VEAVKVIRGALTLAALVAALAPATAAAAPTISIGDVSQAEGNSGSSTASFTVTLSEMSATPVTVSYATENGTATAPSDYTSATGTATVPANTLTTSIPVTINGDTLSEANETFKVNLSNPMGGTIADGQGIGTILDDDPLPSLSITDARVAEGNSGTRNANFSVILSRASGQDVTVRYATADASAVAPGDYASTSGVVTIPAGSTSRTITVPVRGDRLDEFDETFTLNLSSPTGATVSDGRGVGTIVDDDAAPSLTVGDVRVREGNAGTSTATFVVSLSAISAKTVTVRYATANGSAVAGSDYTPAAGTLTLPAGTRTTTVGVSVIGDTAAEFGETFQLKLSRASNASIGDGTGVATIVDDDVRPVISRLSLSPTSFRAARRGSSAAVAVGTRVRYSLSENASAVFRVEVARPGKRLGRSCVRPTRRNRGRRGCRRYVLLAGRFTRAGVAGANSFRFTGRFNGRRLAPGRYRLVIAAVNRIGISSLPARVAFRIVR
jgi:hypothetical protein